MPSPKVLSEQKGHTAYIITHSTSHKLREPFVVQFSNYRGRDRVSLRFHYTNNAGHLAPGRRGIEFAVSMIDDVIEALHKVRDEMGEPGSEEAKEEIPW